MTNGNLRDRVEGALRRAADAFEELTAAMAEVQPELDQARAEANDLRRQRDWGAVENDQLRSDEAAVSLTLAKLDREHVEVVQENNSLRARLGADAEVARLNAENERALRGELRTLRARVAELEAQRENVLALAFVLDGELPGEAVADQGHPVANETRRKLSAQPVAPSKAPVLMSAAELDAAAAESRREEKAGTVKSAAPTPWSPSVGDRVVGTTLTMFRAVGEYSESRAGAERIPVITDDDGWRWAVRPGSLHPAPKEADPSDGRAY